MLKPQKGKQIAQAGYNIIIGLEEHEVEEIIIKQKDNNKTQYYIKQKGYPYLENI